MGDLSEFLYYLLNLRVKLHFLDVLSDYGVERVSELVRYTCVDNG